MYFWWQKGDGACQGLGACQTHWLLRRGNHKEILYGTRSRTLLTYSAMAVVPRREWMFSLQGLIGGVHGRLVC